jgi:hypothetical protein
VITRLVYIFVGARINIGALRVWKLGYLKKEFSRYEYQKTRWQQSGKTSTHLAMQIEALVQGMATASFWPC